MDSLGDMGRYLVEICIATVLGNAYLKLALTALISKFNNMDTSLAIC